MKKHLILGLVTIVSTFFSCTNSQSQNNTPNEVKSDVQHVTQNTVKSSKTNLSAIEFFEKAKELPTATIIDVRTADEFSKGHLSNAINYDWNSREFNIQISTQSEE